jgi:cytoskeleton protein RodZ
VNSKSSDQTLDSDARDGETDGSLGKQLRRAREERGISLREISEQTRITMRHLEAIESDDYKHLPGGIFNKSFIKAYARYVKFDEKRALELYMRTARERGEPVDEVATTPQRSRIYTNDPARSPLVTFGLSALIVGILILVVYAGLHYYRRKEAQPAAQATPTPAAVAGAQTPAQTTPATTAPVQGFQIQVKATRPFWLTSWQDAEKKMRGRMLKPETPEQFQPENSLNLRYDKVSADALEVSVNGQQLRTPTDTTLWTITKDNYKQFLP